MPIQVTCRHCLKRFQVSDKFAGKTGPCPSCKKPIEIPSLDEQVVIHAPKDDSPKDSKGQSVLKPIERKETDVTRTGLLITIGAIVIVFALAFVFRFTHPDGVPLAAKLIGLLLLAPPLIWAGYSFLYDQEREPYVGPELRNRVLICSAIFPLVWCVYAFVPSYVLELDQTNQMSWAVFGVTLCIMIALGAIASAATFEIEYFSGIIHAGMYFISIVLLAFASGVTLAGVETEDDFDEELVGRSDRVEQIAHLEPRVDAFNTTLTMTSPRL
ncbi:hypothetical protein [Roseiconus lacunae]|uniref:Uncharacterized protein n=1 Tax=Roseiconus lacunae TaxID=2605694 RepID=A0ABT7PCB4_9BACT|nr:hypothetical protein [Roseiconus lacunae]MDM4014130.1 hypothetical protein [Roseiconus lacunae]WRQ53431.1 hypothetical protein U8335_13100 [Stieleria sp. HD01]